MADLAQWLLYVIVALTVLLFFGPIVAIVSLIGRLEIGSLKINLRHIGRLGRAILGIIGIVVWLSVYIPLVSLASQRIVEISTPTPSISAVNTSAVILTDTPIPAIPTSAFTSTPTNQVAVSPTLPLPTPTLAAGKDFEAGCISQVWTPYRGGSHAADEKGCWQLFDWGISAQSSSLLFSQQPPSDESHGIYISISQNSIVEFTVSIDRLYTPVDANPANLAFGILPSDSPDPTKGILFLFQVETSWQDSPVFLKLRMPGEKLSGYLGPHYQYGDVHKIKFQLDGLLLTIYRDDEEVSEPINVPFSSRAFWIGYTVPSGGSISANVSGLSVQQK